MQNFDFVNRSNADYIEQQFQQYQKYNRNQECKYFKEKEPFTFGSAGGVFFAAFVLSFIVSD